MERPETTSDTPEDVFDAARRRVDAFAARTFSFRGTIRLHRHALGLDLLRGPANVLLAPVLLTCRLLSLALGLMGLRRAAGWLAHREILLPTAVGRALEADILNDLLAVGSDTGRGPEAALALSEPLRPVLRAAGDTEELAVRLGRAAASLRSYAGTRSAVAEITTIAVVLLVGAILFRTLTPGVMTMAPTVAEALARETAIASFPLGDRLGGVWYSAFPAAPSGLETAATILALLFAASVVTAFAGILADPIQLRLGIHRRRLLRLVDAVEGDLTGGPGRPFAAREHYYARAADIADILAAVLRHVR